LRPVGPHLVYLRWKFHEVARDIGAAEARVVDIRKHAVESVTEFVESGRDFIPREQGGLAGLGFRNVEVVGDDRLEAEESGLGDVFVHPSAAAFRRTGIGIEKK